MVQANKNTITVRVHGRTCMYNNATRLLSKSHRNFLGQADQFKADSPKTKPNMKQGTERVSKKNRKRARERVSGGNLQKLMIVHEK